MAIDLLKTMMDLIGIHGINLTKAIGIGGMGLAGYSGAQLLKYKYLTQILDKLNPDEYPPRDLTKHTWISGVQGSGKSNKLRRIFINTFVKKGWGGIYIDTHGTADEILRSIPENRWDDVIYIAPWMKRVYGINVLQRYSTNSGEIDRISEDVVQVFHKMYPRSWGDKLGNAIRFACKAVLLAEENCNLYKNPTLMDVHRVLTDEVYRSKIFQYVDNDIITNFLENLKTSTAANKLENPLSSETVMAFLCQENGLNILDCMENRKIIICNLDKDHLSENANLMAGIMVSIITQCAAKRKGDASPDKHPYFAIAADEFYEYANKHINVLIEQMRKKNVCVMLANQNRDQMPSVVQSAVAMCQTKFIHTVADEDLNWVSNLYKKWFTKDRIISIPFYSSICDIHSPSRSRSPRIKMQPPYIPDHGWEYVGELKYYSLGKAPFQYKIIGELKGRKKTELLDEDDKISLNGDITYA